MIVGSFKFNIQFHHEGGTVAHYLAEMQDLEQYCEYGQHLNEKLCDWLVCGINDGKIQHRLLSDKALILKDIIVGMEFADKYADNLKQPGTVNPIHVVKP